MAVLPQGRYNRPRPLPLIGLHLITCTAADMGDETVVMQALHLSTLHIVNYNVNL